MKLGRRLRLFEDEGEKVIDQDELVCFGGAAVILGEAGLGKTSLMKSISAPDSIVYYSARRIVNRSSNNVVVPNGGVLLIDGLDELSANTFEDALDQVVCKINEFGIDNFILSCRISDWNSVYASEVFKEDLSIQIREFYLLPFNMDEYNRYLNDELGTTEARELVTHLKRYKLTALLGNPQNLYLLVRSVKNGKLPKSMAELYLYAVEYLGDEQNRKNPIPLSEIVHISGFISLILMLGGYENIFTGPVSKQEEDEVNISVLSSFFPFEKLQKVLYSNIFISLGVSRFTYIHKGIGEFLAAKFLTKKVSSDIHVKRVLNALVSYKSVPSSLRGLYAWLSMDERFKESVLRQDPLAFIHFGDCSRLTQIDAGNLLESLQELSIRNQNFKGFRDLPISGLNSLAGC